MKWILAIIVFNPMVGALVIALLPKNNDKLIKWTALLFGLISLALSIAVYAVYDINKGGFQFVRNVAWIKEAGISFYIGADGISIAFLMLTSLLLVGSLIYSFIVDKRVKEYFIFILILAGSMAGVFVSLDFILFYIFWEIGLVPMYFLIGIWGGTRREYAAIKFFLYTLFGSVFMLLGVLGLYFYSGAHSFSFAALANPVRAYSMHVQTLAFLGIFLGLAIKLPIFPFHTWLPDAHVQAPTAASVLLAGILLKMGGYGFIRIIIPMVPQAFARFAPYIAVMALISIIYGAYLAMAQDDLKKMVAYSSISHMGFVTLGFVTLNNYGIQGAVFQMMSHGLITGLMFMLVGLVYERYHTRLISELHGLIWQIPTLATLLVFGSFASAGMPSLSGFIGELYVLMGSAKANTGYAILACLGIIMTFGYILTMINKINLKEPKKLFQIGDLTAREAIMVSPVILLIITFGIVPAPLLRLIKSALIPLLSKL
ncbi:MAG: NADH-quinone oxidoreductase subunit M [Actinobacteria bacterium]|nr:MAG: NADH-quinone oxidoreductase subunit M [Actinomycetota bacterium]